MRRCGWRPRDSKARVETRSAYASDSFVPRFPFTLLMRYPSKAKMQVVKLRSPALVQGVAQ